jgi:ribosomal protein S12 methylthiotransferase accessory factor
LNDVSRRGRGQHPLPAGDFYSDQVAFFSQVATDGQQAADGRAVQQRLGRSSVLVVGARSVGSHVLATLADTGIGTLRVLDRAVVDDRDLVTSGLLTQDDVGRAFGAAAVDHLGIRNPYITAESVEADATSADDIAQQLHGVDVALVCLDGPSPLVLEAVNAAALRTGTTWCAAQVVGGVGLLGPTVIPHQSACYTCYQLRRNANLDEVEGVLAFEAQLRQLPTVRTGFIAARPLAAILGGLLALEAVRLLSGFGLPQTVSQVLRVDFLGERPSMHRLLRFPRCPSCGAAPRGAIAQAGRPA